MKLYAPKYYKDFKCIADKCRHSCCVGWEIDVDEKALSRYDSLNQGYSAEIKNSIVRDDTPHFRLTDNDRCPHLDAMGLCRIISLLGEDYLCDICREHPRFYNDTPYAKEVGVGLSCEEAARLILSSDNYCDFIELGDESYGGYEGDFDVIPYRQRIYTILSDDSLDYENKLRQIYREADFSIPLIADVRAREIISSLEYLDDRHKEFFMSYSSDISTPVEITDHLKRALAYFVYRHCAKAYDESEYRAYLGFSLFCERMLASIAKMKKAKTLDEMVEIAMIISEELEYSEDNTYTLSSEFFQ